MKKATITYYVSTGIIVVMAYSAIAYLAQPAMRQTFTVVLQCSEHI